MIVVEVIPIEDHVWAVVHNLLILGLIISILELPPGHNLGEAEEDEGGEVVSSAAAVEADSETAAPAIIVGRGHVVVIGLGVHGCKGKD